MVSLIFMCVLFKGEIVNVYGNTTKGGVVNRFDCILVYGNNTKGGVVMRFHPT